MSLFDLAVSLKRDGRVEPIVVVPQEGALAAGLREHSVETLIAPTPGWTISTSGSYWRAGFRRIVLTGWELLALSRSVGPWLRLLRAQTPDVVVTNTAVIPTPALASAIARLPHVWWVREFVTRDHRMKYLLGEPLSQRLIGRLSEVVIANSRAVEGHFARRIDRAKMRTIYQGIRGFQPTPNVYDPLTLRVLLLGRLKPTKGIDGALRAVGILKTEGLRVQLRLVGPSVPSYREELRRLVDELGIADRVEIMDFTDHPHLQHAWANVVLMCSNSEAFGRVTVEALKSGRPVVGTRSAGTRELISDGTNGLLYEPGDADELAAALARLARDPELFAALSRNASASVEGRFTMEEEVETLVAVLNSVVGR